MTAPGPAEPAPGSQVNPPLTVPATSAPVPGQPVPVQPVPAQPVPVQAAAPQPVPVQPVGQPAAGQPVPVAQPPAVVQAQPPAVVQPPAALPVPAAQAQPPAVAQPPAALPVPAAQAQPPAAQPPIQAQVQAPAKSAPPPNPPKAKTSTGGGGYFVAVFALIVAVLAAGVAVYALKIAMDLRDGNTAAPIEPTNGPDSSAEPEPGASTADSSPTPTTPAGPEYTPELVRAQVVVPNPTGCTAAYVDVDTANVGVQNGHEFYLSRCQNPSTLQLRVDRSSGRSTSGDDPTAAECASLVAGTPTSELVLTAEPGATVCLLTNRAQATSQGLPQRLAIVEVLTVNATEVRLALSTYRIED